MISDKEIYRMRDDFIEVARLSGISLSPRDIHVEILRAPHSPSTLPPGKMAVYVFLLGDECLKVGKAGPNSGPRYLFQHYNPDSSRSNLAKSLLKEHPHLTKESVGDWIKNHTDRINFLLDQRVGIPALSLLEVFLQCRLRPRYEGFESQRYL